MRILLLVAVASFLGCLGPKSQGPAMDQNRGFREVAPPDEAEQHAQRSQLTMNKTGKRSYQATKELVKLPWRREQHFTKAVF